MTNKTTREDDLHNKIMVIDQRLGYCDLSCRIITGKERQNKEITKIKFLYEFKHEFVDDFLPSL
jgi:hypothetical protein